MYRVLGRVDGSETGGLDVIRKKAWSFYKTIFGVRLCWELEEPKRPKAPFVERKALLGGHIPPATHREPD